jgi:hypothetical protein
VGNRAKPGSPASFAGWGRKRDRFSTTTLDAADTLKSEEIKSPAKAPGFFISRMARNLRAKSRPKEPVLNTLHK